MRKRGRDGSSQGGKKRRTNTGSKRKASHRYGNATGGKAAKDRLKYFDCEFELFNPTERAKANVETAYTDKDNMVVLNAVPETQRDGNYISIKQLYLRLHLQTYFQHGGMTNADWKRYVLPPRVRLTLFWIHNPDGLFMEDNELYADLKTYVSGNAEPTGTNTDSTLAFTDKGHAGTYLVIKDEVVEFPQPVYLNSTGVAVSAGDNPNDAGNDNQPTVLVDWNEPVKRWFVKASPKLYFNTVFTDKDSLGYMASITKGAFVLVYTVHDALSHTASPGDENPHFRLQVNSRIRYLDQ